MPVIQNAQGDIVARFPYTDEGEREAQSFLSELNNNPLGEQYEIVSDEYDVEAEDEQLDQEVSLEDLEPHEALKQSRKSYLQDAVLANQDTFFDDIKNGKGSIVGVMDMILNRTDDVGDIVEYIGEGRKKEPISKFFLGKKYVEGQRKLRKKIVDKAVENILEEEI